MQDFSTTSPATGETLEAVEPTPLDAIPEIVSRARAAQAAWAGTPIAKRIKAVAGLKARVLARAAEIAKLVRAETGKPEAEALLSEVLPSGDVVTFWADVLAEELEPREAEVDAFSYPKKAGWVHREPRGTIALVTPWNFPFA